MIDAPLALAFTAGLVSTVNPADLGAGVATFVAFGVGMSLMLVAVTVAVALTRGVLVLRLRRVSRHVDRAAAVLLIVAGAYVVFYWAFTLAAPPGSDSDGAWSRLAELPVGVVEDLSSWSVNHLQQWVLPVALLLGGIVFAAAWIALGPKSSDDDEQVEKRPRSPTDVE